MNGQKIDLSFIIPCHNLEGYIDKLILSFYMLNLTNYSVEFIFILDSCTDNTKEIVVNGMEGADFKIIECEDHSCGLARNRGLDIAQGRYIWFVDGDDWLIYPKTARECIEVCDDRELDMIKLPWISNFYYEDRDDMVWQYIFSHDLIKDIRFRAEQPGEDGDFMNKVIEKRGSKDVTTYKIPSYFYNYNRPGSNMTLHNMKKYHETEKRLSKFDLS